MSFEAARCPSCGATIQVPADRAIARCMICGAEVNVQAAIHAHNRPAPAAAAPNWKDILQVALGFIDSGNGREADAQLTRVLEFEPTNGAVWMCKALIANDPSLVEGLAQKAFDYGFADSSLKPALAERFYTRGYNCIGFVDEPHENTGFLADSAFGALSQARKSALPEVDCDEVYRYLILALPLLRLSYELSPSSRIDQSLTLMEKAVNLMPPAGRVIDSPTGFPREANGWFHYTLPALYELRQRIRRDFPGTAKATSAAAPAEPVNGFEETVVTVIAKILVGLAGFGVTFGLGTLRMEDKGTCAIVGAIGAVLAMIFVPLNKSSDH